MADADPWSQRIPSIVAVGFSLSRLLACLIPLSYHRQSIALSNAESCSHTPDQGSCLPLFAYPNFVQPTVPTEFYLKSLFSFLPCRRRLRRRSTLCPLVRLPQCIRHVQLQRRKVVFTTSSDRHRTFEQSTKRAYYLPLREPSCLSPLLD